MKRLALYAAAACCMAFGLAGCLKKDYDMPPDGSTYDPNLTVTHSIKDVLAMNGDYNNSTKDDTVVFNQDWVISGVVTANDRSGNLYKTIVIQDSTAAIQLSIDDYSLYADYPVGRKVYVKLRGLALGYDGGTPVLGGTVNNQRGIDGIAGVKIGEAVVGGPVNQPVMPDTVDLVEVSTFNKLYLNRLLYIREGEFDDTLSTYAEAITTTNRYIQDCDGNSLVVRTSNYADFAGQRLPNGKGPVMGIYTVYQSAFGSSKTPQLLVRSADDVMLTGPRCGADDLLRQDFESQTDNVDIALPGWKNIAETGGELWFANEFDDNLAANITAYQNNSSSVVSWLISPPMDLTVAAAPKLTFRTQEGYAKTGTKLECLISTDYNGSSNPSSATWTVLPATIASGVVGGTPFTSWVLSGDLDLSAFKQSNVYVAFRYTGSNTATSTFVVDDVNVVRQ